MYRREELLISLGVVAAAVTLAAIGKSAYEGLAVVGGSVLIFIAILWLANRRVDRHVVEIISKEIGVEKSELLTKFHEITEIIGQSVRDMRYELFQHWRSMTVNPPPDSQSKIIQSSAVLGLESTSSEVWVWAYRLTWEIEDENTLDTVSRNLGQGVTYKYLLPDSEEIHVRVRQFIDRLGESVENLPLEFRIREDHSSLLDQCVTIYHSNEEPVVVLFPPKVARESHAEQLFVQLSGDAARPIRSNYSRFWLAARPISPSM